MLQSVAATNRASRLQPSTVAPVIAVVIPTYRVSRFILEVIKKIGPEVAQIYVVDDCCPEQSGKLVERTCVDPRVKVIFHPENRGVGGATLSGYRQAISQNADVIVKIDGDGQMDPALISRFVRPIVSGLADYTKGNRFFHPAHLQSMPLVRALGNTALSFISKVSTGYWDLMDPTNGYTCIHARVARELLVSDISSRYFFESDVLFRLNTLRAVVQDIPMAAFYGDEESNLRILHVIPEFSWRHAKNFAKRIFYNYFLRSFTFATLEMMLGTLLVSAGTFFGVYEWRQAAAAGVTATGGTVMLAALPIILGTQMLLAATSYDIHDVPREPLHLRL